MPAIALQPLVGTLLSGLSVLAFYAASPHCPWPALVRWRSATQVLAWLSAAGALHQWIQALGTAAGLCAMLGCWMLAALVMPWLATWHSASAPVRKAGR